MDYPTAVTKIIAFVSYEIYMNRNIKSPGFLDWSIFLRGGNEASINLIYDIAAIEINRLDGT